MSQVQVTVTDEEYSELLKVRLAAKHAYEAEKITLEEYNATRAAVRRARKVRKTEGAVVENYRQQSAPQHNAMTRRQAVLAAREEQAVTEPAEVQLVQVPERRVRELISA